jgi:hypothetical protein
MDHEIAERKNIVKQNFMSPVDKALVNSRQRKLRVQRQAPQPWVDPAPDSFDENTYVGRNRWGGRPSTASVCHDCESPLSTKVRPW